MPPPTRLLRRNWPAAVILIALAVGARAIDRPPPPANTATAPEPRPGLWEKAHAGFVERARQGDVDLVFLGDSITAGWAGAGPIWSRYYAPRKAVNFGIGGDRTQHVLWRVDHGELDGVRPRAVVLLVGTNNLANNTEDQVVDGVAAVVDRVRARLPGSKILLLGIFPRAPGLDRDEASAEPEPRVARVNTRIAGLADGRAVRYLDIGARFLDEDGRIPRGIMPDLLHLSRKGYQIWADAIEPALWELMEGK